MRFIRAVSPKFLDRHSSGDFLDRLEKPAFRGEIHTQGALRFWDVIPELAGGKLGVDILNPHYRDYYQNGGTPHDAGQPVPVFFLIVQPNSTFRFRVDLLAPQRLSDELCGKWKPLLEAAFAHAFGWLGFGAKTAVGYGAMRGATEKDMAAAKAASIRCDWVDSKIQEIAKQNRIPEEKLSDVLRGKQLAEAWRTLANDSLKRSALADIRARWMEKGWWDDPQGGAAKKAKQIYEGNP